MGISRERLEKLQAQRVQWLSEHPELWLSRYDPEACPRLDHLDGDFREKLVREMKRAGVLARGTGVMDVNLTRHMRRAKALLDARDQPTRAALGEEE